MKLVMCTIQVVMNIFITNADVKGKVIRESSHKYLVDFSEQANVENYEGDYSRRLVNKTQCVELSE